MPIKPTISREQVLSDLKNVIVFLRTMNQVMPNQIDETLIEALRTLSESDTLLALLCYALEKL